MMIMMPKEIYVEMSDLDTINNMNLINKIG